MLIVPAAAHARTSPGRVLLVVAGGLAVGCATSYGQTYVHGAAAALFNSAGAWLVAAFVLGALMRTVPGAAAAGLAGCLFELVGYYVTSELRGYAAGGGIVVFWTACAVLGGPVFGAAGLLWRSGRPPWSGVAAGVLPAAFVAEGLWLYLHVLQRHATAALWLSIGAVLAVVLPRGWTERRWLLVTIPIALAGEVLLEQAYVRSF